MFEDNAVKKHKQIKTNLYKYSYIVDGSDYGDALGDDGLDNIYFKIETTTVREIKDLLFSNQ